MIRTGEFAHEIARATPAFDITLGDQLFVSGNLDGVELVPARTDNGWLASRCRFKAMEARFEIGLSK